MKYLPLTALFLLACCTPMKQPGEAIARVNQEFDGRYVGLFFASYGGTGGSLRLEDGGRLYHWVSIEPGGGGATSEVFSRPGGTYGFSGDTGNGEMISGYCKVDITTNNEDHITSITLAADSIGKFGGSRCSEIFGQSDK